MTHRTTAAQDLSGIEAGLLKRRREAEAISALPMYRDNEFLRRYGARERPSNPQPSAREESLGVLERQVNIAVQSAISFAPEGRAWIDSIVAAIAPGWHWVSGPDHTDEGFHIALTRFDPASAVRPQPDEDRNLGQARALLIEAAALFREYEAHHRREHEALQDSPAFRAGDEAACSKRRDRATRAERNADIAGRIEAFVQDGRKPWVEPTITELPSRSAPVEVPIFVDAAEPEAIAKIVEGGGPHSLRFELAPHPLPSPKLADMLTISGVDLPNPKPASAPTSPEILNAMGWLAIRADMQPERRAEFESVARVLGGAGVEILRQAAEITELQGMLEDAIGPVRLVSQLATMTDTECEFLDGMEVRDWSRNKLDGDFTMPRYYGSQDRERALKALISDGVEASLSRALEYVDIVASALGLRRAAA